MVSPRVGRLRISLYAAIVVALFYGGLSYGITHAQTVWSDVRHEVVVRNNVGAFTCTIVNSAATTLTAFGGSCVAGSPAGPALYITDIVASASAIATATTDQYLSIKSGTGGSCGTATATVWSAYNVAFAPVVQDFTVPIKVAAGQELCWMDAVVGSKTLIVSGYTGP